MSAEQEDGGFCYLWWAICCQAELGICYSGLLGFFFLIKKEKRKTQDNVYKPFSNKTNYKEGESIKEVKGIEGRPPKVHIQSNKVHKCVPWWRVAQFHQGTPIPLIPCLCNFLVWGD